MSDPVQSKSAWTGRDYESSGLIQTIPYTLATGLFTQSRRSAAADPAVTPGDAGGGGGTSAAALLSVKGQLSRSSFRQVVLTYSKSADGGGSASDE